MERFEEIEFGETPPYFQLVSTEVCPNDSDFHKSWDYLEIKIYEFWYMGNLVATLDFWAWMHNREDSFGGYGFTVIEWMV
jgi:hypothetical protein